MYKESIRQRHFGGPLRPVMSRAPWRWYMAREQGLFALYGALGPAIVGGGFAQRQPQMPHNTVRAQC
jgi:hypothetical protein